MVKWINEISSFERFFLYLAVPFTIIFIIQFILMIIGIGHGEMNDIEINADSSDIELNDIDGSEINGHDSVFEGTFKIFTIRNIISFFTVFGWSGLLIYNSGKSKITTMIISLILGVFVMTIISVIYKNIYKLTENGTLKLDNAQNCIGEVYIPIPGERKGIGKIQIIVQGALRELDAATDGDVINTGTKVVVIKILENNVLLVEKFHD